MIVECSLDDFRVEPSQGTHFFQNMTSANAGYVNVNEFARAGEICDTESFDSMAGIYESHFRRHVRGESDLVVVVDGKVGKAVMKLN